MVILVNRRRQNDHTVLKRRDVAREFPKMVSQVGQVGQYIYYIDNFVKEVRRPAPICPLSEVKQPHPTTSSPARVGRSVRRQAACRRARVRPLPRPGLVRDGPSPHGEG